MNGKIQWARYMWVALAAFALGLGVMFLALTEYYQPVVQEAASVEDRLSQLETENLEVQAKLGELQERAVAVDRDREKLFRWLGRQPHEHPTEDEAFPWFELDQGLSREQVSETLFTTWLNCYMDERVLPDERLAEFLIESIEILEKEPVVEDADFQFWVVFSVKPYVMNANMNSWVAGNGEVTGDGWVSGKSLCMQVAWNGHAYRIVGLGTAC